MLTQDGGQFGIIAKEGVLLTFLIVLTKHLTKTTYFSSHFSRIQSLGGGKAWFPGVTGMRSLMVGRCGDAV